MGMNKLGLPLVVLALATAACAGTVAIPGSTTVPSSSASRLAAHPGVTYDIVGARPPQALKTLAGQCAGVCLHGYVADAVPFWTHTAALAVPLLSGGGIRVKILEAMAMGLPVVSTTAGCEGLEVRDGEHLLIADTANEFARACAEVLQDKEP